MKKAQTNAVYELTPVLPFKDEDIASMQEQKNRNVASMVQLNDCPVPGQRTTTVAKLEPVVVDRVHCSLELHREQWDTH